MMRHIKIMALGCAVEGLSCASRILKEDGIRLCLKLATMSIRAAFDLQSRQTKIQAIDAGFIGENQSSAN